MTREGVLRLMLGVMLCCLTFSPSYGVEATKVNDKNIKSITKYLVKIPQDILEKVKADNPGIGSSLKFRNKDEAGNLWFYSISDRGLNLDAGTSTDGRAIKIFPQKDFSPFISLIKVEPDKSAQVEDVLMLQASGLPIPQEKSATKVEVPLTMDYKTLEYDKNGIDSEGIALDKEGNFWISDEYVPSLVKISSSGKTLDRIDYTNGMPQIMQHRMENRGIEAIEVSPSGNIVFTPESVLDIDKKTSMTARFIRIFVMDPLSKKIKTYAYEYDQNIYQSPKVVKIGDIVSVDDGRFLIIEQGKDKNGKMRNTIQLIDLQGATDITDVKLVDGRELEFANAREIKKINPVRKKFLVDAKKFGWPFEKMEGIAYIDPTHFAIINDNDFGYEIDYINAKCKCKDNYKIDLDSNKLLFKEQDTEAKIGYKCNNQNTQMWIMETKKPFA